MSCMNKIEEENSIIKKKNHPISNLLKDNKDQANKNIINGIYN